jgi:hypothetical protein
MKHLSMMMMEEEVVLVQVELMMSNLREVYSLNLMYEQHMMVTENERRMMMMMLYLQYY